MQMVRYAPYVNRALARSAGPAVRALWRGARKYAGYASTAGTIGKALVQKASSIVATSGKRRNSYAKGNPRAAKRYKQANIRGYVTGHPRPRVPRSIKITPTKADGHMESSKFTLVRSLASVKGTGKNQFTYLHSHQEMITGQMGRQGVNELFRLGTYAQIIEDGNNIDRRVEDRLGFCMFNQIPTQAAAAALPTIPATGNMIKFAEDTLVKAPQKQFVWESVSVTQTLGNLTNVPVQIVIYWCKARSDCTQGPQEWWNKCENDQNAATSVSDAPIVTTDNTVTPGTLQNGTDMYGRSPRHAKGFGKCWTIDKTTYLTLQPGVQHKLIYKYIINKKFTYQDTYRKYVSEGNKYIGGLSIVPLIVTRGSMVTIADGTEPSVTKNVTYSKQQIGVITQLHFKMREMKELPRIRSALIFRGIVEAGAQPEKMIDNQDDIDEVKVT